MRTKSRTRLRLESLEDRCLPSYAIVDLSVLPDTYQNSTQDINNYGQVAGTFEMLGRAALWTPASPNSAVGSWQDLGVSAGFDYSYATRISSNGWVAGYQFLNGAGNFPAVWIPTVDNATTGTMYDISADIPDPATRNGRAQDVNNEGKVVGFYDFDCGGTFCFGGHGFMWEHTETGNVFTDINTLLPSDPVLQSQGLAGVHIHDAKAINDNNQIVANGTVNGDRVTMLLTDDDGLFYNGGLTVTNLGNLGGWITGRDINSQGQVVGEAWLSPTRTIGNLRGFVWDGGSLTELPTIRKQHFSEAFGISDDGTIVGRSGGRTAEPQAVVWQNGRINDLTKQLPSDSGWMLRNAYAVNTSGQIVGEAASPEGLDDPGRVVGGYHMGYMLTSSVALPQISISDVAVVEGDTGTSQAVLNVVLSEPSTETITVKYFTNGTFNTIPDVDFQSVPYSNAQTITFNPGETSKPAYVNIFGDTVAGGATDDRGEDKFYINLIDPTNAVFLDSRGRVTIIEDEPGMVIKDTGYAEGNSGLTSFVITVELSTPAKDPVSVDWFTSDDQATVADNDYMSASGTLIIPEDQSVGTITVQVVGDTTGEPTERFLVFLDESSVVNAHIPDLEDRGGGWAYVMIENDDGGGGKKGGRGNGGPKKLLADAVAENTVIESMSADVAKPLVSEAISRLEHNGVDVSGHRNVQLIIVDLPGLALGMATGNTIFLDTNAAGWGWFVDPTPWEDSEFTTPGNQGEMNRMDLLTVISHELGHLLGYEHAEYGVMQETLAAGQRHLLGQPRAWEAMLFALAESDDI